MLKIGDLKISISKRVRNPDYSNSITIKLRNRGAGDRAIYIDTTKYIKIDRFVITVAIDNKEYEFDSLIDFNLRFEGFYIGFFDGEFKFGGKIRTPILDLIEAILTFRWIDEENQEVSVHGTVDLDDSTPFNANFCIDTTKCTQVLTNNWLSFELGNYKLIGSTDLNAQSYLEGELYADLPYTPQQGDTGSWLISVDNGNQSLTTTTLKILRVGKGRGINISVNVLQADEFWISGTCKYTWIPLLGYRWVPITIDHGGYLDFSTITISISLGNNYWKTIWDGAEVIVGMGEESYDEVAVGQTVGFEATVYGGTPPYTYAWTFPGGTVSNQQNPTYTFSS